MALDGWTMVASADTPSGEEWVESAEAPSPAPVPSLLIGGLGEALPRGDSASLRKVQSGGGGIASAEIECAICLEPARSPRRFPHPDCPHMYCATCLANLRGRSAGISTNCPQCRRPATSCRSDAGTPASPPVTPVTRPTVSSRQLETERRQRTLRLLLEPLDVSASRRQRQQEKAAVGFITRTGTKYHAARGCRGLRNATLVWEGSTQGKEPCSLCVGGVNASMSTDARTASATSAATRTARPKASLDGSALAATKHFTTRTGKAYHHLRTCAGLRRATTIFETPGSAPTRAQQQQLRPCKLCCR